MHFSLVLNTRSLFIFIPKTSGTHVHCHPGQLSIVHSHPESIRDHCQFPIFPILAPMILKLLLQFAMGIGVGIYGYLVPSYLNLAVLQLSLSKKKKAVWTVLLIISIIEIPYCFLCMNGMHWIMKQETFLLVIKWLLAVVLLGLAVMNFITARKEKKEEAVDEKKLDPKQIRKLILLAIFNPFQLSAWTIWGVYFIEKDWFIWTHFSIFLFSIAASIGVFGILAVYAFAGEKLVSYFSLNRKQIDYTVAGILFVLGVVQVVRNLVG